MGAHAWAHTPGHTRLSSSLAPSRLGASRLAPSRLAPSRLGAQLCTPLLLHTSAIAHLCYCTPLLLHTSAIARLCSAQTSHVLVLDDDMLPGSRYLQQLLHVIHSPRRRGLLGSIGWLLPRPNQELRFGSYRSLTNDSGGLCVPRPVGAAVRVRAARAALP